MKIRWDVLTLSSFLLFMLTSCDSANGPGNDAPVANAGQNQTVMLAVTVELDGSSSSDPDGDDLTFTWTMTTRPTGSTAELSDETTAEPSFLTDTPGIYVIQLTVSDGEKEDTDDVTVTAQPMRELTESITSATTLTAINPAAGEADYLVNMVLDVDAALTIAPGVVIVFGEGAGFDVNAGGSLTAIGTVSDSIFFRGAEGTPGFWYGLFFDSNATANQLAYVTVSDGGYGDYADVYISASGRASVINSTLRGSSTQGIYVEGILAACTANLFVDNTGVPISVESGHLGALDESNDFSNTGGAAYVSCRGGTVSTAQIWEKLNVPVRFSGSTSLEAGVEIKPGAEYQFTAARYFDVGEDAYLKALGTTTEHIVFRGVNATAGFWQGIYINSNDVVNQLLYTDVSDGGYNDYADLYLTGTSRVMISNSSFTNSSTNGVYAEEGAIISTWSGNTVSGNTACPVSVAAAQVASLTAGSILQGNIIDRVEIRGGAVTSAGTWAKQDVPYRVIANVWMEAAVTVSAGAAFLFNAHTGLDVTATGSLYAVGTTVDSIRFEGTSNTPGYWYGITIGSNNVNNVLTYAVIANGGYYDYANVYVYGTARVNVSNSLLRDSSTHGIYGENGAQVTTSGNTYARCPSGGLYIEP